MATLTWNISELTFSRSNTKQLVTLTYTGGQPYTPIYGGIYVNVSGTWTRVVEFENQYVDHQGNATITAYLNLNDFLSYYASTTTLSIKGMVGATNPVSTSTVTATLDAPPIISDISVTSDWTDPSIFIAYVTSATVRFKVTPQFGATVTDASGSIGSWDVFAYEPDGTGYYSDTADASAVFGSGGYVISITDSRGATVTYNGTFTVREHNTPSITLEVTRCDVNGDKDFGGGYLSVTAWATANPSYLGINSLSLIVNDESTTIVSGQTIQNGVATIVGNGAISADMSYDIRVDATDGYNLSGYTLADVPAVVRILNLSEDNQTLTLYPRTNVETNNNRIGTNGTSLFFTRNKNDADQAVVYTRSETLGNGDSRVSRIAFAQFGYNSSTYDTSSNYERYNLPYTGSDLGSNKDYDIVTTKYLTSATLTASGWSNSTQTVTVQGVTSSNMVMVTAAPASMSAYMAAGVYCSAQGSNSLTFKCTTTPTVALTVNMLIVG